MTLSQSILATLSYHDIFDYPLTAQEVHQYLIVKRSKLDAVVKELLTLTKSSKIGQKDQYYFLKGRTQIVSLRKQRQRYSKAKIKKALFFAKVLKIIPTLKLMAISGALAMQNSHKNDDIDLVLITSQNTLWTTRFVANILLVPFKRDVKGQKVADRACLNVFLEGSDLKINPPNLYLAHEICQMKPIWDRDNTYRRFIDANKWVYKFLPNWQVSSQFTVDSSQKIKPSTVNRQLSAVETFLKKFQLWYMKGKITTERIGKHQLFFHPQNTGEWVMGEYQRRLKKLGQLLVFDKVKTHSII